MESRVYCRRVLGLVIVCMVCGTMITCSSVTQPPAISGIEGTSTWLAVTPPARETPTIQILLASTPSHNPIPSPSITRAPTDLPIEETALPTPVVMMTEEPMSPPACGRQIAFQSTHLGVDWIGLVDVCSQQVRWLTDVTQDSGFPQWSPNGEYIAFLARSVVQSSEDYRDLWLIDMRTTHFSQVTHDAKIVPGSGSFFWSPNSKEIIFSGEAATKQGTLIVDLKDGDVQALPKGLLSPFSWSPDGTKIALAMDEDLYNGATPDESVIKPGLLVIIRPDGKVIAGNQEHGSYPLYSSWYWLWSPDSQLLAIAEWPMARGDGGDIKLIETEGQNLAVKARLQDLMPSVKDLIVHSLAWSPSSEEIAFVLVPNDDFGINPWGQVYIADRRFTHIRTVTPSGMACAGVEWSPDGFQLVFACDDGPPKASLWLVNADGTDLHRITDPEEGTGYPQWQPVLDR